MTYDPIDNGHGPPEGWPDLLWSHLRGVAFGVGKAAGLDDDGAQDVAQEAVARLYAFCQRGGNPENADAYITTIAQNWIKYIFQTRDRESAYLSRRGIEGPTQIDPASQVVQNIRNTNGFDTLSRRQQEAVVHLYEDDIGGAGAAEAMGISQGSVETHRKRALRKLRFYLLRSESGDAT